MPLGKEENLIVWQKFMIFFTRLLRQNAGKFTIEENGMVATDFTHLDVFRDVIRSGQAASKIVCVEQISAAGGVFQR